MARQAINDRIEPLHQAAERLFAAFDKTDKSPAVPPDTWHRFLKDAVLHLSDIQSDAMTWRAGWDENAAGTGKDSADGLWVSLINDQDRSEVLPIRQVFLSVRPDGQLVVGVQAVVAEDVLTLEGFEREIQSNCPDVLKMIVRARKGKKTREAWSLDWAEPLMVPAGTEFDINSWLALMSALQAQKVRCLAVQRQFDLNTIEATSLARRLSDTVARLTTLLAHPDPVGEDDAEIADGAVFARMLRALRNSPREAQGLDRYLAAIRETLKASLGSDLIARLKTDGLADDQAWIEFVVPRLHGDTTVQSGAGILLSGHEDAIELVLEQALQFAVSKFGGRAEVKKLQERRQRSHSMTSPLAAADFHAGHEVEELEERPTETVKASKTILRKRIAGVDLQKDENVFPDIEKMIEVFRTLRMNALG